MSLRPIRKSASTATHGTAQRTAVPAVGLFLALALVSVIGQRPAGAESVELTIETATNGSDADAGSGPSLNPGDSVTWTYTITVNGQNTIFDLIVSDSRGVMPNCDITGDGVPDGTHIHPGPLDGGQSFTCTASGTVHPTSNGTYSTVGAVKGFDFDGVTQFNASDPTHYTPKAQFVAEPGVAIRSLVNGADADSSPGPYIAEGTTITWSYVVTNTGNVPLSSVSVTNTGGVLVDCGGQTNLLAGPLGPGQSATCTGTAPSADFSDGLQASVGSVQATALDPSTGGVINQLTAQDPHNYTPVALPGALAFTGPTDHLLPGALLLIALGAGLMVTGSRVGRRTAEQ